MKFFTLIFLFILPFALNAKTFAYKKDEIAFSVMKETNIKIAMDKAMNCYLFNKCDNTFVYFNDSALIYNKYMFQGTESHNGLVNFIFLDKPINNNYNVTMNYKIDDNAPLLEKMSFEDNNKILNYTTNIMFSMHYEKDRNVKIIKLIAPMLNNNNPVILNIYILITDSKNKNILNEISIEPNKKEKRVDIKDIELLNNEYVRIITFLKN